MLSRRVLFRSEHVAWFWLGLTCLICWVGLRRVIGQPINGDAAWLLYVSQQVLEGSRLYVDLIEINPPLIIWLSMPAVVLERLSGISHATTFPLMVALAAAVSVVGCFRLSAGSLHASYRGAFAAGVALILFVLPFAYWGQREHLMLILCLPHLIEAAGRMRGARTRSPLKLGIAAGLGYALKPHYALAFLAVELIVFSRTRKLWPVAIATGAVGCAYIVAVIAITPEYFPTAMMLRPLYAQYYDRSLSDFVLLRPMLVPAALSLAFVLLRGEGRELRVVLACATAAWILAFMIQGKGWTYHLLPGYAGALLLLWLGMAAGASSSNVLRGPAYVAVTILALALGLGLRKPTLLEQFQRAVSLEVMSVMERESVMVLTPDLGHVWPAVTYTASKWPARVPSLWPFVAGPEGNAYGTRLTIEALRNRPTVLVLHPRWNDMLTDLLKDSTFARIWYGYEAVDSLEYVTLYRWAGARPPKPISP
jgi:hypothetical protein